MASPDLGPRDTVVNKIITVLPLMKITLFFWWRMIKKEENKRNQIVTDATMKIQEYFLDNNIELMRNGYFRPSGQGSPHLGSHQ